MLMTGTYHQDNQIPESMPSSSSSSSPVSGARPACNSKRAQQQQEKQHLTLEADAGTESTTKVFSWNRSKIDESEAGSTSSSSSTVDVVDLTRATTSTTTSTDITDSDIQSETKRRRWSLSHDVDADLKDDDDDDCPDTDVEIEIQNFRRVSGLKKVHLYRSSAPESAFVLQMKREEAGKDKRAKMRKDVNDEQQTTTSSSSSSSSKTCSSAEFALHKVDWFIDLRFPDGTEGGLCYRDDLEAMLSYKGRRRSSTEEGESDDNVATCAIQPITTMWTSATCNEPVSATATADDDGPIFDPPVLGRTYNQQHQHQHAGKKRWYMTFLGDGTEGGKYSQRVLFDYVRREWIDKRPTQKDHGTTNVISIQKAAHQPITVGGDLDQQSRNDEKRIALEALVERGLAGMSEVLLFQNMPMIRSVLQTLTLIWETHGPNTNVLMYCTLGKDRTGHVVALCQYLMGMSIEDIAAEYAESEKVYDFAYQRFHEHFHGRVDPAVFAGAPSHVMVQAFDLLKRRYGGNIDGYFDDMGFTAAWRKRFVSAASSGTTVD
jgi:hypothetical protein